MTTDAASHAARAKGWCSLSPEPFLRCFSSFPRLHLPFTANYHNDSWMRETEGKPAPVPAPTERAAVKPLAPGAAGMASIVRNLACQSGTIGWSNHVLERMEQRGISRLDVIRVLQLGDIKGPVEAGANEGEVKLKMAFKPKGRREIGVVTIVMRLQRLFLKTVEWEDR